MPFNSASDAFELHPDVRSYGPSTEEGRRVHDLLPGRGAAGGRELGGRRAVRDVLRPKPGEVADGHS